GWTRRGRTSCEKETCRKSEEGRKPNPDSQRTGILHSSFLILHSSSPSDSHEQAIPQHRRKTGSENLFAGLVDVRGDPIEPPAPFGGIEDRIRGGAISIPRLPDRTRIDEIATIGL